MLYESKMNFIMKGFFKYIAVALAMTLLAVGCTPEILTLEQIRDHNVDQKYKAIPVGFTVDETGKVINSFETMYLYCDESFWGFGEKFNSFNKRGQTVTVWQRDAQSTNSDISYKGMPYFMSSTGYSVLMNTFTRTHFNMGATSGVSYTMEAEDPYLDYYMFCNRDYKGLIRDYTELSGRSAMIPRWAFGFWMSRMSYMSRAELEEIVEQMAAFGMSVDVIHIDAWQPNFEGSFLPSCTGDLLIFDEVVTGFRIGPSGAQGYFGVDPDLTVFGKIIAGGYPGAGGVGGHADCMAHLGAGLDSSGKKIAKAMCGGTMAATPISCVAGYYALCEIEKRNACEVAGRMGDRLTAGLQKLIKKYDLPFVAFNQGSICHLDNAGTMHFSVNWKKPWTIPALLKETGIRQREMEHIGAAYMAEGIVTLAGSRLYTSAAYTEEMIDDVLRQKDELFELMKGSD